jgi:hypothetical protein
MKPPLLLAFFDIKALISSTSSADIKDRIITFYFKLLFSRFLIFIILDYAERVEQLLARPFSSGLEPSNFWKIEESAKLIDSVADIFFLIPCEIRIVSFFYERVVYYRATSAL